MRRWPIAGPSVLAACREVVERALPLTLGGLEGDGVAAGSYDLELSPWGDGLLLRATLDTQPVWSEKVRK